jgi:hypothetical protein
MADVVALSPTTPHPSSLAAAADAFLDHADLAATTRRVYRQSLAALVDGLGPARAIADLTGELLDDWFRARYATVAPATWNRELATLRSAVAWWRAGRRVSRSRRSRIITWHNSSRPTTSPMMRPAVSTTSRGRSFARRTYGRWTRDSR